MEALWKAPGKLQRQLLEKLLGKLLATGRLLTGARSWEAPVEALGKAPGKLLWKLLEKLLWKLLAAGRLLEALG